MGKGIEVKKLTDSHFYKSAETFTKKNVSKEDIIFLGDTLFQVYNSLPYVYMLIGYEH